MENGGRSMGKVGLIVKFWNEGCMILDGGYTYSKVLDEGRRIDVGG